MYVYVYLWVPKTHQHVDLYSTIFYIGIHRKKEPRSRELETSSSTVQYFEAVFTSFLLYFNKTGNLGGVPQCASDVLASSLQQHCYPGFILMWQELVSH